MQLKTPDVQNMRAEAGRPGRWWLATLVSFIVFIGVEALIAFTTRDGLAAAIMVVYGSFIGALVCVILATVSVLRKEKHRVWAIIPAVPCAGLLMWELSALTRQKYQRWQSDQGFKVYGACIAQLKADPEIAFREHWPADRTTDQSRAFFDSVWAPYVQFSASQVERIYAELPPFREVVFKQAACTPEFISAHFQEAFDLARKTSTHTLENIVHHPHTPLPLVQRVVFSRKQLPFEPPYQAGLILQLRKSGVPPDPRGILQPFANETEGKFFVLTLHGHNFHPPGRDEPLWFYDEVNSYVPGVPQELDLLKLGPDELIFLPGLYTENSPAETQQLRWAESFALEHNQNVLRQRAARTSSH